MARKVELVRRVPEEELEELYLREKKVAEILRRGCCPRLLR